MSGAALDAVRAWVEAGASGVCDTGDADGDGDGGGGGDSTDGADTGNARGWCRVQAALQRECLASASRPWAGWTWRRTPTPLVAPRATGASVAPGDRDGSLLWRKLQGTQASGRRRLPPAGALDDAILAPIGQLTTGRPAAATTRWRTPGAPPGHTPTAGRTRRSTGTAPSTASCPAPTATARISRAASRGSPATAATTRAGAPTAPSATGAPTTPRARPPGTSMARARPGPSPSRPTRPTSRPPPTTRPSPAPSATTPRPTPSPGHVLLGDTTPGQAEVRFAGPSRPPRGPA